MNEEHLEREVKTLKKLLKHAEKEKRVLQQHILKFMNNGDWYLLSEEKPDLFEHTKKAIALVDERYKATLQEIKDLRSNAGAGLIMCKKAIELSGGDKKKALSYVRERL
jgi:predicted patatin/cPLA2 family phospholipase